jgi:cytochrome b561
MFHALAVALRTRRPGLPLPLSPDIGATIANLHGWLGDALLWLAGLHAVAAIYHQVVLKDGELVSMLPAWFPAPRR